MKRARPDADTDALVRSMLAEEAAVKAAKKGGAGDTPPADRAPRHADPGGPVKEEEAGMAAHKRAAARRAAKAAGGAAATELGRWQDAEEELAPEAAAEAAAGDVEAGAVPLEPFNMKDEREAGAVDGEGNLVQRQRRPRGADDGSASDGGASDAGGDAWLASVPKAHSAAAATAAARAAAAAAAEDAPMMTPTDVARLKASLATFLAPGETVAAALRRLAPVKGAPPSERLEFDRATDAAAALAGAPGVRDAFALTRDECAAAAAAFCGGGGDDDDMFADGAGAGTLAGGADVATPEPPAFTSFGTPNPPPPPPPGTTTDFTTWPVAELARYVREAAGGGRSSALEKSDLVAAAVAAETAASTRRAETAEASPPPSYTRVAPGWWWSEASGLWWHAASGAFTAGGDGRGW